MHLPVNRFAEALKMGVTSLRDSDEPVRIAVFVDSSATPFLINTIREALVPQTTSALVRVQMLSEQPSVKADTDISIVISCGSEGLQQSVQQIVVAGAPTVVVSESSVEVPFVEQDTRMLGSIASTNKTYLLEALARWILDRTEKDIAFASNFPFMRIAAANRIITSCALTNMATGALAFIPGSDFPVMTVAQLGMMLDLSAAFGKPLVLERGYEAAGVVAGAFVSRALARAISEQVPRMGFIVKALVGAAGTVAIGRTLMAVYERDVDYSRVNEVLGGALSRARGALSSVIPAVRTAAETGRA